MARSTNFGDDFFLMFEADMDDESDANDAWDNEIEGDPPSDENIDEASLDLLTMLENEGVDVDAPQDHEATKTNMTSEYDAYEDDPSDDDGVPDIMEDSDDIVDIEMESSLF